MLVTKAQFQSAVESLKAPGAWGLDTESTGLTEKDRLFCITLSNGRCSYYFNFNPSSGCLPDGILPKEYLKDLKVIFDNPESMWYIHNAKHDLKFLAKEGIEIHGKVICTEVRERVVRNNFFGSKPYSLASCAKRRGLSKDESVDEYIMEHSLYTPTNIPGKKKVVQLKHFEKVPFEIISKRAEGDADLHFQVGTDQLERLKVMRAEDEAAGRQFTVENLASLEVDLTPVCFRMERKGVRIDEEYTKKALDFEEAQIKAAEREFELATGIPFSDGRGCLVASFDKLGEPYPKTAKGNPSFTEDVLEGMRTPVAQMVNKIRKHKKRASTYYSSFIYFAHNGVIHPNMRQSGTETGRFSYSDPNLQNVPKEEDDEEDRKKPFHVRACFIPPEEGWPLVSLDYNQQEFRMMLDYAGELGMIKALNEGADPHDEVKNGVGCTRREAKVLNFGIPYGMGKDKLAGLLGKTPKEAQEYKEAWFGRMPKVKQFFHLAAKVGVQRGYVRNWAGRRCFLSDPSFDYILPNHLIQGGCADIIKHAMVKIDELQRTKKLRSYMDLQVHDELRFSWHPEEFSEILEVKKIMESVYNSKHGMRFDCSVDHSFKSWGYFDKVKGEPK